ncbi:hypothetical protein HETIRDRAFT_413881 [Heterobasidion irregulare TC 32-1]|uniref:Uncharacterized protein n=1 Tax=Heterobasidion irregulare (strain TC 32-1) TaxID=747525 RepID=W4KPT3_HETIT|nr:uncharacterized protein HETIRDRAFT_413881 [Heterobasidion irregulare TC 32-1]ETW87838.1 hypothetical protein HETIRDRAFT_413881 [Heterobasidion irregulare TC 32-1]
MKSGRSLHEAQRELHTTASRRIPLGHRDGQVVPSKSGWPDVHVSDYREKKQLTSTVVTARAADLRTTSKKRQMCQGLPAYTTEQRRLGVPDASALRPLLMFFRAG